MPKLRVRNRFWIIPNMLLNDPEITLKSKWLFWYLQSKPEDWDFSADRIKNDTKESRDAILSWLKELEQFWYLKRIKYRGEKWQWFIDYILYDKPVFDDETTQENPTWWEDPTRSENPTLENPTLENPTINKKRNTKKEIIKKIIYIEDPFINSKILEFIENRKQLKKQMTDLAIKKLVNKCMDWQTKFENEKIWSFFDRAIESGWTWVFELKDNIGQNFQKKPKNFAYQEQWARENFTF